MNTLVSVGIDIGGTFTDVVLVDGGGSVRAFKVPTDAGRPEQAVLSGLARLAEENVVPSRLLHATTVATNALLEAKAPPVALLTTAGFAEVLRLRRVKRSSLYSIGWDPPTPLVPLERIGEIDERISADGEVLRPLTNETLDKAVAWVGRSGAASIAVCLLHSYVNPEHERLLAESLRQAYPEMPVTLSSEVNPEVGEFERTSTTVAHAALKPVLSTYLEALGGQLEGEYGQTPIFVMQSSGGLATSRQVIGRPAAAVESGPAAGALAGAATARTLGLARAISFDMGGTTAKTCLIEDGRCAEVGQLYVGGGMHSGAGFTDEGGMVVREPALDVVEVGAGGGSICRVVPGGVLTVGPDSAGATPGPACFGRGGTLATVTDAVLALGMLGSEGSELELDRVAAENAIAKHVAEPLGIEVHEAAWLIFTVANSNMIRAIEAVSSERGRDPAEYGLIAFGGGGPTHAAHIAALLGMKTVIVPAGPDTFSARGLHQSLIRRDEVAAVTGEPTDLESHFGRLAGVVVSDMKVDGLTDIRLTRQVDVRFTGQTSTLTVDVEPTDAGSELGSAIRGEFLRRYEEEYGSADPSAPVEFANLRVRGEAMIESKDGLVDRGGGGLRSDARVYFGPEVGWLECLRVSLDALHGERRSGPVLVTLGQSTAVVPPGWTASAGPDGSLTISLGSADTVVRPGGDRRSLEIFHNALGAIVDRMAYTIARTAYSTVATEQHDFSLGICDAEGQVVHQGAGVLIHLGTVGTAARAVLRPGRPPMEPGDVILLNDPYDGGTHLPDFVVVAPVFHGGSLIAHLVVVSHMSDVGGLVPGSFMSNASELIQEGIVVPPVKLYAGGQLNRDVLEVVKRNSRQPEDLAGDVAGLVSAVRLGGSELVELAERMGVDKFTHTLGDLVDYAETRGRQEILALGEGSATFVDHLDNDGVSGKPVDIQVNIRIQDGRVAADFAGTSPQVKAGINATMTTTRSVVTWCLRTLMSEGFPDNDGLRRLIDITAEDGSIVNAVADAPVANRGLTAFRTADCVFGALAQLFPGRVWATGDGGAMGPITFGGRRSDGSFFTLIDGASGVTGARPWADGLSGVAHPIGNSRNKSVEVIERRYPVRVLHYGTRPGSGGAGRWRGGDAMTRIWELLAEEAIVVLRADRKVHLPWGLEGGQPGLGSAYLLIQTDGTQVELPSRHIFTMRRGERLVAHSAGGGGYGTPEQTSAS